LSTRAATVIIAIVIITYEPIIPYKVSKASLFVKPPPAQGAV
jgi:hypothetical protein